MPKRYVLCAAIAATTLTFAIPAYATTPWDTDVTTLMAYAQGATRTEVIDAIESLAHERHETREETARFLVAEVKHEAREAGVDEAAIATRSSKKDDECSSKIYAKNAHHRGDIMWTAAGPASIEAWNHVAVYTEPHLLSEAPGVGRNTRRIRAENKCVSKNWGRYALKGIPWSARERAKTWAHNHLNKPYKKIFWSNKKIEDTHYNCSQFVWAAYKISGYDLDSNGGPGVYPDDIKASSYLVHY